MEHERTLAERGSGSFHDVQGAWGETTFPPHHSPINNYHSFPYNGVTMEPPMYPRPQQRSTHQQLQPLAMPPWPSLLTSQSNYANGAVMSAPVSMTPVTSTPKSAPPSFRTHDRPRKTLTDDDRRRMCQYAADNPTVKQTEIGAMFGVERSTVSKVLRNKEKYLRQDSDDDSKQPPRVKKQLPDIDKALSNWVKGRQSKNQPVTDALIKEQLRLFATTVGGSDVQSKASSASWLEKFKARNGLSTTSSPNLSRKNSYAEESTEGPTAASGSGTPNTSPTSPQQNKRDASPMDVDGGPSEPKRMKSESPPALFSETMAGPAHKPFASISSAFTDGSGSMAFTSPTMSPESPPFFEAPAYHHHGQRHQSASVAGVVNGAGAYRQRSQTFPMSAAPAASDAPAGTAYDAAAPYTVAEHMPAVLQYNNSPADISPADLLPELFGHCHSPTRAHHHSPGATNPPSPRGTGSPPSGGPLTPASDLIYGTGGSANASATNLVGMKDGAAASGAGTNSPSLDETRRALEVVWNFFQHQPLEPHEFAVMGKLMEKLKLHGSHVVHHHHPASAPVELNPADLVRIADALMLARGE